MRVHRSSSRSICSTSMGGCDQYPKSRHAYLFSISRSTLRWASELQSGPHDPSTSTRICERYIPQTGVTLLVRYFVFKAVYSRLSLMLLAPLTPAAEAAVFTLGLVLIRAQRHRAEQITNVLTVVAVVCLVCIAFLSAPVEQLNTIAEAAAMADMGASIPLRQE